MSEERLRGVLENRCSAICSKNPWSIPMKKFNFSKVVDLIKFFIGIFQEFWLQISPGISEQLFSRTPFSLERLIWLLPSKAATRSCSGKKVVWDVFFSEKLGSSGCSVKSAGTLAKLWIYFLHQNTFYSLEKEPVLVSAKLTWKKRLTKKRSPAAAFVYCNKGCVSWYRKTMNKVKCLLIFVPPLFLLCYPLVQYFEWNQGQNRGMHRAIVFGNSPSADQHCVSQYK